MSSSLTVYVCIYLFFWIEVLLKSVYLLTGHKIDWQVEAVEPWAEGAKALSLQLEAGYQCNCPKWICLFAVRGALGPCFSLQGSPKALSLNGHDGKGEFEPDRAHALDAVEIQEHFSFIVFENEQGFS